jgi:hypothetical protein
MSADIVPGVRRPPTRADYEPIIRSMRPFVEGEELMLRSSLLLMRDRATATKLRETTCAPAWALLDVVERCASESAMNHLLDIEYLRELRRLCLNCVAAASSFDTLFQPRLPLGDDGEANARG